MQNISDIGWIVLGILGFLVFVVLMLRGVKLGIGDKTVSVGSVDRRFTELKADDEERKKLFKFASHVDDSLKGDLRRIVRSIDEAISNINPNALCEFTSVRIVDIIKGELFQRLDDNNLKECLSVTMREGYFQDIERRVRERYNFFQNKTSATKCGDVYPEWEQVEPAIYVLIRTWGDESIKALASRMREKIERYIEARSLFRSPSARKENCDDCITRNRGYLKNLGVENDTD
ncbi:MAG: hypothetical protein EWM51_03650 [Treponema sp.]|nr:MAG: hypothetical protein EWM51_03650 [Treponema sp.]